MNQQAREIMHHAIPNICASLIITDADGLTVHVSQSFTNTTGYGLDDLAGKKPGNVLQGENTSDATVKIISDGLKYLEPIHVTIDNYCKDGSLIVFILDIQPVWKDEELLGFIGFQQNATDLRKQIMYSDKLTSTLVNEVQHRTNLLSLLRHDVRDSLGFIKMLDELGELNNDQVLSAVESCLGLVQKYVAHTETCNVSTVVDNVVNDLSPRTGHRNITIYNKLPSDLTIRISKEYMFIALRNFIMNAIKFSGADSSVVIQLQTYHNRGWHLAIIDHGIGMNPDLVHLLLNSNKPLPAIAGYNGSRSGFILCRQLLSIQEYNVHVVSTEGQGTTIYVGPLALL